MYKFSTVLSVIKCLIQSIDHGVILLYHTYLYVCIILYQACWLDSTVNVNNYAQCKFPPCNKLLHLFKKTCTHAMRSIHSNLYLL